MSSKQSCCKAYCNVTAYDVHWSRRHAYAGQDARIAAEASRFLQISAPSLLLNSVAICLRNHLLAQLDVVVASRAPQRVAGLGYLLQACWCLCLCSLGVRQRPCHQPNSLLACRSQSRHTLIRMSGWRPCQQRCKGHEKRASAAQ